MTNAEIADRLALYALVLELAGADAFRVRSYQTLARRLGSMSVDVGALANAGRVTEIPGVGAAIARAIETLVADGSLPGLDTLADRVPEATLLAALERRRAGAGRIRLDEADAVAARLLAHLFERVPSARIAIGGALRRRVETVHEIPIVASVPAAATLVDAFLSFGDVEAVRNRGRRAAAVTLGGGLTASLHVVPPGAFGAALVTRTGDDAHVATLSRHAAGAGLRLTADGLFAGRRRIPVPDEAALYGALGAPFVEPVCRDVEPEPDGWHPGDASGRLVNLDDLQGFVHVHSTWSDGRGTIAEMAGRAGALGARYVVIADHSRSATYAGGLTAARVRMQHREIDALNTASDAVRIIKGIEVDILGDGRLDFDDDILSSFEVVIASIHGAAGLDEAETFARLSRALAHPAVHVLGHPTGRFLLQRDPYVRDTEHLIELCIENRVTIEINALPRRLDLDWRAVRSARARDARFVVSSDAHSLDDLDRTTYGIDVARKGGLAPADVLNTCSADAFLSALRNRGETT